MSIFGICKIYGISRQSYYKFKKQEARDERERGKIITMIQMIRKRHLRMGIKKIYYKIKDMIKQERIKIGRDKLYKLAKEEGYLVKRKRSGIKTTRRGMRKFDNLLKGEVIERINQVWVSDITYIRVGIRNFGYLFLLMDLYSRKIVGFKFGKSLEARWGVVALEQAIREADGNVEGLIHHSDHGIQYISREYTEVIERNGMLSSMGEVGNAYDNAYAERVIGILKNEYGLCDTFISYEDAEKAIREAIILYNMERPHLSLNYATPNEVYENIKIAPLVEIKNDLSKGG